MFRALRVRQNQGSRYILDPRTAKPEGYVGRPEFAATPCEEGCSACRDVCPTAAIALSPLRLDLGRCVYCQECVPVCPTQKLQFTADCSQAATTRTGLVIGDGLPNSGLAVGAAVGAAVPTTLSPIAVDEALRAMFGRSLKLRSVSTGGCNGCELELNALGNVNFDLGRYGIEFVASPRHADALVLSGPLTRNMHAALRLTFAAMPAPKFVIAFGACAISGGLYQDSPALERSFLDEFAPSLYLAGCPPHPLTFVRAILDLLGIDLPSSEARNEFHPAAVAARRDSAERLVKSIGVDLGRGKKA